MFHHTSYILGSGIMLCCSVTQALRLAAEQHVLVTQDLVLGVRNKIHLPHKILVKRYIPQVDPA
jgi:hypothetical protein